MNQPADRRPQPPALSWQAGRLAAPAYGDSYHSAAGALAEARAVFVDGQDLPARFARGSTTVVGELGFGTGLNFLATWQAFRARAPVGSRLVYLGVEKHPLTRDQLADALAGLGAPQDLADALVAAWPPAAAGLTWLPLSPAVDLGLAVGEAAEMLRGLPGPVDAWLLDGFAPARNPAMWEPAVMAALGRLSAPGATAATFSAARAVRDGLAQAGFTVARRPGFAGKRHRLAARLPGERPSHHAPGRVAVLGGGLAGAWTAWHLARRGLRAEVVAADAGASANPAVTLALPPAGEATARVRFRAAAFRHTRSALDALAASGGPSGFAPTGLLHIAVDDRSARRLAKTPAALGLSEDEWQPVDHSAAEALAGCRLAAGGAYVPRGGWLAPSVLVAGLLAAAGAPWRQRRIAGLHRTAAGWHLHDAGGRALGPYAAVVLATGAELPAGAPALPVEAVRGQADWLSAQARGPACPLSGAGYAIPQPGTVLAGASFDRASVTAHLGSRDSAANAGRCARLLPDWAAATSTGAWAGRRAVTPDRLPLAGSLGGELYANLGHGARGAITAPLGAAAVAAALAGEPLPLEADLAAAVTPTRFAG